MFIGIGLKVLYVGTLFAITFLVVNLFGQWYGNQIESAAAPASVAGNHGATPSEVVVARSHTSPTASRAKQQLADLETTPQDWLYTPYERDEWIGGRWEDADHDCQNTRAEVLITESRASVSFTERKDGRKCTVATGRWIGPWTGNTYTSARDLDVDHHVPVANAHRNGGHKWSPERRAAYYNDLDLPAALNAMDKSANQSKGARGPENWRPPLLNSHCRYATDWISVKHKYRLMVTQAERAALQEMLRTC